MVGGPGRAIAGLNGGQEQRGGHESDDRDQAVGERNGCDARKGDDDPHKLESQTEKSGDEQCRRQGAQVRAGECREEGCIDGGYSDGESCDDDPDCLTPDDMPPQA